MPIAMERIDLRKVGLLTPPNSLRRMKMPKLQDVLHVRGTAGPGMTPVSPIFQIPAFLRLQAGTLSFP